MLLRLRRQIRELRVQGLEALHPRLNGLQKHSNHQIRMCCLRLDSGIHVVSSQKRESWAVLGELIKSSLMACIAACNRCSVAGEAGPVPPATPAPARASPSYTSQVMTQSLALRLPRQAAERHWSKRPCSRCSRQPSGACDAKPGGRSSRKGPIAIASNLIARFSTLTLLRQRTHTLKQPTRRSLLATPLTKTAKSLWKVMAS